MLDASLPLTVAVGPAADVRAGASEQEEPSDKPGGMSRDRSDLSGDGDVDTSEGWAWDKDVTISTDESEDDVFFHME